jgi:HEAT repeat protein
MAVTMDDVRRSLMPDEADLHAAARFLGPEALPHLEALIEGDDVMFAAKAAYVAGLIADPRSAEVVQRAARSGDRAVRMAAATVARQMPAERSAPAVVTLLRDDDAEMRQMAVAAITPESPAEVRAALATMAQSDPHPHLRALSSDALRRMQ